MSRDPAADQGSATLELVLLTPVILLLLSLIVFAGRVAEARGDMRSAAGAAARAASLERSDPEARAAARQAALDALSDQRVGCRDDPVVEVSTVGVGGFQAGNQVSVTVSCRVHISDLAGLSLPGTLGEESTATEPIDEYRRVDG